MIATIAAPPTEIPMTFVEFDEVKGTSIAGIVLIGITVVGWSITNDGTKVLIGVTVGWSVINVGTKVEATLCLHVQHSLLAIIFVTKSGVLP
mmetsp:Transcript_18330/g.22445  ORF Transcript_18330/g.22445 Transcript_18330/m.22445 type:complete len:92 (+) Transcript_18330:508-783(+)